MEDFDAGEILEGKNVSCFGRKKEKREEKKNRTHLNSPIPLPLPIPPRNPLPHNLHNLPPPPAINKNHKPQPRKLRLILLVQSSQLRNHFLASLQLRLLSGALRWVDFWRAEAGVRGEDWEEEGRVGGAEGEEVRF